jgi:hypothetical protein
VLNLGDVDTFLAGFLVDRYGLPYQYLQLLLENHRKNKHDVRYTRFLVPCGSLLSSVLQTLRCLVGGY